MTITMATPRFVLLLLCLLPLLTLSTARPLHPCGSSGGGNTLIFSFSLRPLHHHIIHRPDPFSFHLTQLRPFNPNPNPNANANPFDFLAVDDFQTLTLPHHHHHHRLFLHHRHPHPITATAAKPPHHLNDSLKDRTLDILSVVMSLLLGAACGALTAGIMYFVWSIFIRRHGSYHSFDDSSDDDDNNNDDLYNPKKPAYVAIPDAPKDDSDVKKESP